MNAKHDAVPIRNVIATNAVKVECVNHFVAAMMTVDMVKCVKTLFVQLDVVQILIVPEIWHALAKNASTHVLSPRLAVPMQIVWFTIM